MIRRGREQGWLVNPVNSLRTWAQINGVSFDGVTFGMVENRGTGVLAERDLKGGVDGPLMIVPRDLILSRERVEVQAKSDRWLREVLDALGEFGMTSRGAILVFLLQQATINCPHVPERCGVLNPFTDYIKFLPEVLLPTFWWRREKELLVGTTLQPALDAKMKKLNKEFEQLRTLTQSVPWCAKHWWDKEAGLIRFDDWLEVDAMYRSRALEFPGIGDVMVPCLDMANHAADDATVSLYEANSHGDALLILRDGSNISRGDEVTITYGDKKGACEMTFSYGFLDGSTETAKELFLDLQALEDDPLGQAKTHVSSAAPGVRIFDQGEGVGWDSDFVWLLCVNTEDGLGFRVLQTVDGERELKATWKDEELDDTSRLKELLETDSMWDVFHLRAVSLIRARVENQIRQLDKGEDLQTGSVRERPLILAMSLRALELELLRKAYATMESQVMALAETDTVKAYLSNFVHDFT